MVRLRFKGFMSIVLGVVLLLTGCTSGKRLGEAKVEHRRYGHGWHVNVPNGVRNGADVQHGDVSNPSVGFRLEAEREGATVSGDWEGVHADIADIDPAVLPSTRLRPLLTASQGHAEEVHEGQTLEWNALEDSHRTPASASKEGLESDGSLPEAIGGRHPDAVPGFILSLGWFFGLIGANVLDYLQSGSPGIALALGFVASGIGYFTSRNSHRMSTKHPDLYPRGGLSKAARWVAAAFLAPLLLYVVLIIILLLTWGF